MSDSPHVASLSPVVEKTFPYGKVVSFEEERADNDLIGTSGDGGMLLPCQEVDAVCRSMKLVEFRMYRRQKYVLGFDVIEPVEYQGTRLHLYLRKGNNWKRIPPSSKLFKAACVALGRRLRNERILKSDFVGVAFRCRLRTVDSGGQPYSVVDSLLRKLTS